MSESDSEGIISKSQLAEFAELFDRFEFADDPRSQQACEAERMFNAKAEIAFDGSSGCFAVKPLQ